MGGGGRTSLQGGSGRLLPTRVCAGQAPRTQPRLAAGHQEARGRSVVIMYVLNVGRQYICSLVTLSVVCSALP